MTLPVAVASPFCPRVTFRGSPEMSILSLEFGLMAGSPLAGGLTSGVALAGGALSALLLGHRGGSSARACAAISNRARAQALHRRDGPHTGSEGRGGSMRLGIIMPRCRNPTRVLRSYRTG